MSDNFYKEANQALFSHYWRLWSRLPSHSPRQFFHWEEDYQNQQWWPAVEGHKAHLWLLFSDSLFVVGGGKNHPRGKLKFLSSDGSLEGITSETPISKLERWCVSSLIFIRSVCCRLLPTPAPPWARRRECLLASAEHHPSKPQPMLGHLHVPCRLCRLTHSELASFSACNNCHCHQLTFA